MMKKFAPFGKKTIALMLVASLSYGVFMTSSGVMAEEEVPVLSKEDFINEVLTDNRTISGLEDQLVDMEDQLDSLESMSSYLGSVHSLVPRYNVLGEKYLATKDNDTYFRYLSLGAKMAGVPVAATVDEMTEWGILDASLTAEQKAEIMTVPEYLEYLGYQDALFMFGLTGKTVTAQEEYDTFIVPIYIGHRSLTSGMDSMKDGIVSAKKGLEVGASQLYNTVLMLSDLQEIMDLTYETSKTNYQSVKEKYDKGLLTESSLLISENDMVIAQLNSEKMARNIDNLKMNMNIMMGRQATEVFDVTQVEARVTELKNVDYYIEEALVQRSEIIGLNRSIEDQTFKKTFVNNTFSKDDYQYKLEAKNMDLLELDLESTKNDITVEIYKLYNDVSEAEQALDIAYQDLAEAKRQYSEVAINVEQGFVTVSTLSQLNLMVTNAVNGVATSSRDYLTAVESLVNASSFSTGAVKGGF